MGMGAAGLTSSSIEMASKGNLGIEINLNKVPCREAKMSPYEIMLSESQERMLIVLENGKEELAKKIFDKWNLDFAIIGKTTNTKNIELFFNQEQVANIPVNILVENSPMYDRKWKKSKLPKKNKIKKETFNKLKIKDILKKILSSPNICSKEWIWQQYDHTVMGDTIQKPGGDSGVVRVHGTEKAIAASVDSSAVYCWAHPLTGGKQVVAESWRNLISVGATPIAITNCLNFGSPENEDNMGEFVECVQGIGEAAFRDHQEPPASKDRRRGYPAIRRRSPDGSSPCRGAADPTSRSPPAKPRRHDDPELRELQPTKGNPHRELRGLA